MFHTAKQMPVSNVISHKWTWDTYNSFPLVAIVISFYSKEINKISKGHTFVELRAKMTLDPIA